MAILIKIAATFLLTIFKFMKRGVFLRLLSLLLFLSVNTLASESWTRLNSANFTFLGDANEKDIRRVQTQLEQFRQTFQELFPNKKFNQPPITVFVFKNAQELKDFQLLRTDGKFEASPPSYFLAGEDANFIALASGGEAKTQFQPIFHDYIHLLLNQNFGRAVIPPWVNEGLAEYFQTFSLETDETARLGEAPKASLLLLRDEKLIPLERFLALDYYTLRNQGNHGENIFYAQSWALFHYFQERERGTRREQLKAFLSSLLDNQSPNVALEKAFQTELPTLEKELKNYAVQHLFNSRVIIFKGKTNSSSETQPESLTESEAVTYQGDLLLHLNRLDEAANLLRRAIALDSKNALANALLGATLARQNKFDQSRPFFEKAIALAPKDYRPYFYYADALRHAAVTDENFVRPFSVETTEKMGDLLEQTIELNADLAPAYRLSALVEYANNSDLNDAAAQLNKALLLEPGNELVALDLGRIYYRQEKFDEARALARKVFAFAEDARTRANAQVLLNNVNSLEAQLREIRERNARRKNGENDLPSIELTPEELINQSLNEALRKPKAGEKRAVGYLSEVACGEKLINFVIEPKNQQSGQTLRLRANDFLSVAFMAFTAEASGKQVGCGARQPKDFVVATYRPPTEVKPNSDGEIVAIEFVPKTFELKP